MFKTVAKLLAAVTAALLLFSGCADPGPQVAAVVGDSQISVAEVDSTAKALSDTYASVGTQTKTWGEVRMLAVSYLIFGKMAPATMQLANVQITDAQFAQIYGSDAFLKALADNPDSAAFAQAYAEYLLLQNVQTMGPAYLQVLANTPVTVNPQFGSWDAAAGGLTGQSGSMSTLYVPQTK